MTTLHPVLHGSPYRDYVYAYPHKSAYRPLEPRPLSNVWATESRRHLFLYVHVPFCTMRCGFCNLFTTPNPNDALASLYLDALRTQAEAVRAAIPDAEFARFAIGGGTPTYFEEPQLATLFDIAERIMGVDLARTPVAIETSPDTITPGKLALLCERGVNRVSIGVQSFVETETASCGRPQRRDDVESALALLAGGGLETLNIDLIYGLPGQTVTSWLDSLERALRYEPDELYLYPLYVRPLTGLGRSPREWDDIRLACYRAARERLLTDGLYEQVSMRMFRRRQATEPSGPIYCCQSDGMVGLGCGARSYTRALHYSLDYAVMPKQVKAIIADYVARDAARFAEADYGFALDADEQRRRYLLQSILQVEGLSAVRYGERFGTEVADDFPDLLTFADLGLLRYDAGHWRPTSQGLERSDALGPWFFSRPVRGLTEEYQAK